MKLSFGMALKEKGIQLRYPTNHNHVKYLYEQFPEKFPLPFIGCNELQIREIMDKQNVDSLPEIYLEFLSHMGVKCGDLFLGYDVTYRYLGGPGYSFADSLNRIAKENNQPPISHKFFSFWNQQGHSFAYFHLDEGDDPCVYGYGEILDEYDDRYINGPVKVYDHLSEFLTLFIRHRESQEEQDKFLKQYAMEYRER